MKCLREKGQGPRIDQYFLRSQSSQSNEIQRQEANHSSQDISTPVIDVRRTCMDTVSDEPNDPCEPGEALQEGKCSTEATSPEKERYEILLRDPSAPLWLKTEGRHLLGDSNLNILLDFVRLELEVQETAITRGYPGLIEALEWMTQMVDWVYQERERGDIDLEWEEPECPVPEWEEPESSAPEWEEPESSVPEWEEPERPQPKRGESVRPQPKRGESVRPQPKREKAKYPPPRYPPAEGEFLLVPPPPPWEDCVSLPPQPAEGEYLLVPPPPPWVDCVSLPPPPGEGEYLLVPPPPPW
ncbi:UNVERIFIED_CONTAM: hypothetical protein FKN15_058606 [Acipenser sinensis]